MAYNEPTGGKAQITNSLDTWLRQARNPLTQAIQMFQPGGGYGAGQTALIEEQAKQAKAEALANQVASGMSSGSLATSTGLRVGRDVTTAKLGVEDQRTQYLNQLLQALSNMYGQFGQLSTQRELGMAGIKQNQQAAELGALSNARGSSKSYLSPWDSTWGQPAPQTNNQGYATLQR